LKWRWREKMRKLGKPVDRPNLVLGTNTQVCWHKFLRYWDVEERAVPLQGNRYVTDPELAAAACDENTIGVVTVLGSTFTGEYENVSGLSAELDRLQERTGLDIPIHVDGASGAFVAPFIQPDLFWDFKLPRVKSINASGHKYGLVYPGVGWIVWREEADLHPDLIFNVDYLGGTMPTLAINFSRPASQVVTQYYNLIRLGRSGIGKSIRLVRMSPSISPKGLAKSVPSSCSATDGTCRFAWTLKGAATNWSLYDLADRLRDRGWQVPAYRMPANRQDLVVQRVVVRNGFTNDLAEMLLRDIRRHLDWFATQPGLKPTLDGAGFHH
ncbi:MAG: glutamate decarboxylase, partial [Bryobacteraceae bacterium]